MCVKGECNLYPIPPNNQKSYRKIYNNIVCPKIQYLAIFKKRKIYKYKYSKYKKETRIFIPKKKKNMMKNHINFAHPNKSPDFIASLVESPSVATEITMRRRTKNKIWKKTEFRVVTIVYPGKLRKNQNDKRKSAKNEILGPGVDYTWGRY